MIAEYAPRRAGGSTEPDVLVHRIRLSQRFNLARSGEPVTLGLPFAKGACFGNRVDALTLVDGDRHRVATQTTTLDRWSDGSARWVLVDFQADHDGRADGGVYELHARESAPPEPTRSLTVDATDAVITVQTGAATYRIVRGGPFPFADVHVDGRLALDSKHSALTLETRDNQSYSVRVHAVAVEDAGPLRAVIRLDGTLGMIRGTPHLTMTARLHFFAGLSSVQFDVTVTNPRLAAHPGGFWELGDPGSVHVRDLALRLALPTSGGAVTVRCSAEPGAGFQPVTRQFELYQDSSGGENWQSSNHLNRDRVLPVRFRGYRQVDGEKESRGLRATPIVSIERDGTALSVSMPQFWQNFPKAIEADEASIVLRLFPRQFGDTHEIQGGEQKTHTFFVCFGRDSVTTVPLAWSRDRLFARANPSSYCATSAVAYLTPAVEDPHSEYLSLVSAAIEGDDTFDRKRERVDEFGWRHFGDIHADHETAFEVQAGPVTMSHYNNQYDAVAGFAYQFLRSGDRRWLDSLTDLAAHVVDIDVYHTTLDKAAYNGGLFWHTTHYVDAKTSTHRSYPQAPGVCGGGPSCEHNYSTGLMLHYFLTGSRLSRETVVGFGEWVIAMDDGRRNPLGWIVPSPTGLASATASYSFHGPGRGAGNSLNTLLDAYRLSGDSRFVAKAEELICRVVHPADDVSALNLDDAEHRWSYTVFMQAIGKYLDEKAECAELDWKYAYARESLRTYARWMAEHERPYLDRPDRLEYPTETWAAQEMRKSEVFKYAAMHASDDERPRFLERGEFFFQASIGMLLRMSTRTFTRPVVLLMSNGWMAAYFMRHPQRVAPAPAESFEFGRKRPFVPQKALAKRVLSVVAMLCAVLTLAGAALWFF